MTRGFCAWGVLPLLVVVLCLPGWSRAADNAGKLTGDLPAVLDQAGPQEKIPVYFVMADQLEGGRLVARVPGGLGGPERRRAVTGILKAHALQGQKALVARLAEARLQGKADRIRPLWIGNVVGADLTPDLVRELAALPEVARVNWNPKRDVFLGDRQTPAPSPAGPFAPYRDLLRDTPIECGVQKTNAPRVWNELGNTGAGAVIAVIDTGVCWTHPDIANQIWVNPGEDLNHNGVVMDPADQNGVDDDANGFIDDLIGWNFDYNTNQPTDENSHGSHCAGTVAGDGTSGFQSGMAPDAKIMVVRVGVSFSDEVDVWNAMQYAADNGADGISMSLGWPHGQNPDRPTWRNNCENTIEAGTVMVIAAGNEGQGNEPDNVRTPGDVPRVITVGATDCNDIAAGFSSRGPVTWQDVAPWFDHPFPPGLIKPDVSAPGVDTQSHNLCSGYSYKSGTSMATPHVAGAVALIKSSNPGLTHDDIKMLLEDTSVDLGDPGKDNTFGSGRIDAYEAVLLTATPDGRMAIRELKVNCSGLLHLTVADADLKGDGTVAVTVTSATEPLGEVVTLVETGFESGAFKGEISVGSGPAQPDGVVQSANGETLTATYIDADNGSGGINIAKTDTASTDCAGPAISNVRAEELGLTTARIRWTTDESSSSLAHYGPAVPPALSAGGSGGVTHDVPLSGLTSCTVYYYDVASTDTVGNTAAADNGGLYFHFETLADFGAGPQSCHGGRAKLDQDVYSCSATVTVEVSDLDLNQSSASADTATLLVTSTTESAPETVLVTETGPNTSRFRGTIATASGPPAADGVIQVRGGDTLTVTYLDADDGTGRPAASFDLAQIDCRGPAITGLTVDTITDQRATIRFTTDEPADTRIEWGTTPALGQVASNPAMVTSHSQLLNRFDTCQRAYFRVSSTDRYGNTTLIDQGGTPLAFNLWLIPGLYFRETFENGAPGWTLGGEWQVGTPQGRGGSFGQADPVEAYNNSKVLGHDLTGLGAFPGDYEPNVTESARMPAQNGTTWANSKLIIYKRLNVGSEDDAMVFLWTNNGLPIYRSNGTTVTDGAYQMVSWDISQRADGAQAVAVEFKQKSDGGRNYSGWNIDDVIIKNGALPDYAACGACGGGPSFAGVVSAVDNDACGSTGVTVSWNTAVSWGTGTGGTYHIYRGTTPGFVPSPANRIAYGVAGLAYNDTTAPAGGTLYYLVRAENNETCSSGPQNGGVVDQNSRSIGVTNSTTQPVPAAITGLTADTVVRSHLRLAWPAAAGAVKYRIYRSTSPQAGTFSPIGETADLFFNDAGQGQGGVTYFYLVKGVNACAQEGP